MPGCLDAEGLELEWIGGGDGIMGRGDWKKFSHARASGARRISPMVMCIQCIYMYAHICISNV